jgi:drug/metabolite transporter (DMT)-like permease
MISKRVANVALIMILCLFWGLAFVAIKIGLDYVSPVTLTFLRFLISSTGFAIYFITNNSLIPLKIIPRIALLGFVGFTVYHLSLNLGETQTSSGVASLVITTAPSFIAIFSKIILKEKITSLRAAGIVISFLGLIIVLMPSLQLTENPLHVLAILPAPLSAALYTVLGKKFLTKSEPVILTGYAQFFGLLFLLPLLSHTTFAEAFSLPIRGWLPILFLGICSTVIAYTIWYKLLKDTEATMAGSYSYVISLIAISSGHIILNESFTINLIVGGLLVIFGVYLIHKK